MIDGLTTHQQRHIAGQHHRGHTVEQIAEHWGVSEETVKAVVAHRAKIDEERGVIRLGPTE